jgi:2-amino-4-hydroxy-6-hydroxymethyldihydropteridine diphosphokinase
MAREKVSVFVGLGANLGNAQRAVLDAVEAIGKLQDTQVIGCSSLYRSAPFEATGPDYLNVVLHIESRINAYDLLLAFQALENAAGRERPYRNAPRTLDIDLLLFGDARIASAKLTVPHPRMNDRAFVLYPLAELAPDRVSQENLGKVLGQDIKQEVGTVLHPKLFPS